MSKDDIYQVRPIKAPRTAGASLRFLTGLLENKVTGALLSGKLLTEAGVTRLRKSVSDDSYTLSPPWPMKRRTKPARAIPVEKLRDLPVVKDSAGGGDFSFESIDDFGHAYSEGRLTPEQVAQRVLDVTGKMDRLSPPMRIFISQNADDIMSQARQSTKRWKQGKPLGPLDGVPIAVKDEVDQVPYPTTVGTSFLGHKPASKDAFAVSRLRKAGALLIGKANMHEIGLGVTGINPHHGSARNPYDPARATGGSSSGPAAAVAAGVCPVSLGADGGGSIRIPASLCGMVGLKPSFGRISEQGAAPLCWSVAHLGPIGSNTRDTAIAYGIMAGTDPDDPHSMGQPQANLKGVSKGDLKGVKLGVFRPWFEDADKEVVDLCGAMVDRLQIEGAKIVEIDLPELALLRIVHMVTIVSEMSAAHIQHIEAHRSEYGYDTRLNLNLASHLTAADYIHAQRLRVRLCDHFAHALKKVDAIMTPATGCAAPKIPDDALKTGESNLELLEKIMRFAPAANITGLPAISFPAGYTKSGMPVGLQAMGGMWQEHLLLRIAWVAESTMMRKRPKVYMRLLSS